MDKLRKVVPPRAPALLLRRNFLGGLAALSCLPVIHGALAQSERERRGQAAPLRFVMMFTGNGQTPEQWLPTGGDRDFQLSQVLAPLEPLREKLLVVHGLHGAAGHSGGMTEGTTGRPPADFSGVATGGPSIDQYFAELWRKQTPLPSLELGVHPSNGHIDQICYSPRGFPIPPMGSPSGGFDRVFAATNEDPARAKLRRQLHLSVLDDFAGEIVRLQPKLGTHTRALLDEHLQLVREQEAELKLPFDPLVCDIHDKGENPGEHTGLIWAQQTQNIVAALRCGATRVASLRAGGWGGISHRAAYDHIGISRGHHSISHGEGEDPVGMQGQLNHWHCQQLTDLLQQLDAVPEGDGTLLDHTLVIWLNELGLGPISNHGRRNVGVVLAGGSRAGIANGRVVDLAGADYQHFLFTLAATMGEPSLASFGDHGAQLLEPLLA